VTTFLPFRPGVGVEMFRRVWRDSLDPPGFAVVVFERPVSSRELRQAMWELVESFPVRFAPERLGRFDQQVSSKFHRDGAPDFSLLLLGYEPTTVTSRVFVADAARAARHEGLGVREFLAAFNPIFPAGEEKLRPFVTELHPPTGAPHIVAVNNSVELGLLHRAVITAPDPSASRVINSMGLALAGDQSILPPTALARFLARDDLD
jgi:hypothetical protein